MTEERADPEKQRPLSPKTINKMIFNTNDFHTLLKTSDSLDLSNVFSSSDSATQQQVARMFASSDSQSFKSTDFLKNVDFKSSATSEQKQQDLSSFFQSQEFLKSLQTFQSAEQKIPTQDSRAAKSTFSSKDWMGQLGAHVDVNYDKNSMFHTGELSLEGDKKLPALAAFHATPSSKQFTVKSKSNKWLQMYEDGLKSTAKKAPSAPVSVDFPRWPTSKSLVPDMPPLTGATASVATMPASAPTPAPVQPMMISQPQKPATATTHKKPKKKRVYKSRKVIPQNKTYVEYTDNDVLLGRGGLANKHPGNKRYRDEIENTKDAYRSASKEEKTEWAELLVKYVQNYGGRFLEKEKETGKWYVVPDIVARRKAGQALREDNTAESRAAKRDKYKKSKQK